MKRIAHLPSRAGMAGLLMLAAVLLTPGGALAAHPIGHTGSPGGWYITDRAAEPGAKCSYNGGGTAGTTYLTGIKLLHGPQITGIHDGLRSVGYRPIIQEWLHGAWVNVVRGTLITGQASRSHPVSLAPERTAVPTDLNSYTRFRLVLKLIWYRNDASIEATRRIAMDSYVRLSGGIGSSCTGRIITADH
jgi:hypothetical protein